MLAWPPLSGYLLLTAVLGGLVLVVGSPGQGYVLTDVVGRGAQGRTFITQARVAVGPVAGQLADGGYYAAMLLGFGCAIRALDSLAAGPGPGGPVAGRAASPAGYAVAAAMKTCRVLGSYLLLTALLAAIMLSWQVTDGGLQRVGGRVAAAPFAGCVLAGAVALALQRLTARHCRRAGLVPARPPRWFSLPLVALGLLGLALGEYAFFVGDVMGQLHVSDAVATVILGSQWSVVVSGLGGVVRLLAALAGTAR